ncbi:hypothetical protein CWI85_17475 [Streptomyces albidoflavus]|nr:hypothetical protein CWI85_17475 [Streptomyces albidoflavus]
MRGWSPPVDRRVLKDKVLPACAGVVPSARSSRRSCRSAPRVCRGPRNPGLPPAQCHRCAHQTPPAQCPPPLRTPRS